MKEIKRENGKLKKTYNLSFPYQSKSKDEENSKRINKGNKTRTPSPSNQTTTTIEKTKQSTGQAKNDGNRTPKRKQNQPVGEIEVLEGIKPNPTQKKPSQSHLSAQNVYNGK